jgi:hypothetical protein
MSTVSARRQAIPSSVGALVRHGEQRFRMARVAFGHGVTNARDEAAYLTLHTLKLPLDQLPLTQKVSTVQAASVLPYSSGASANANLLRI